MNDLTNSGAAPSKRYARFVLFLLFLLYMFDYMDRLVIVSLFPYLKKEWGLTDTDLGLLVSAVYWSILIFSFPVSIFVDRWSRTKSISIMAGLWSLATLACAFTRSFGQLFVARTMIGIGEAGYAPGGTAMISTIFPQERRAKMLGLWNAAIPLGSALGMAIGGIVAQHYGWRHAFGLVALPGMLIAILFCFVRDYQTVDLVQTVDRGGESGKARMTVRDMAALFARNRTLIFNNLAFAANVFVTTSLLVWLPTYFHRIEGLEMSQAALKGGAVMMMAFLGAPLGGYLADRWMRSRVNARMLFPTLSSLLTAALLVVAFSFPLGNVQYGFMLAAGMSAVAFVPASVAVTQDVMHPGLRAVSLSVNVVVQHLLGSSLGPLFVGAMSDRFGLVTGLICLPIFCVLGGTLFFIGSYFYRADLERVEKIEIRMEG